MPSVRKVHTNLVGSSGFEFDTYISVRGVSFEDPVMGDGRFPVFTNRHFSSIDRVAVDRCVDLATACQHTRAYGQVVS
jgi:hypothetical protein